MKTSIKTFVYAIVTSLAFLACSGNEEVSSCGLKAAARSYGYGEVPDNIKELDSYKELDPICKTEQKKLVSYYDFSTPEINWDYVCSHAPGYKLGSGQAPESGSMSQGKVSYEVNGVEMTEEEYGVYRAEFDRKYSEEIARNERDLSIPCVIFNGAALLTDKEIAELKAKYDGLLIEDYTSDALDNGGGETDGPVC